MVHWLNVDNLELLSHNINDPWPQQVLFATFYLYTYKLGGEVRVLDG